MSESRLMAAVGALLPHLHQPNSEECKEALAKLRNTYMESLHEKVIEPHAGQQRTAPIKMQCAMLDLSNDELMDLKKFIDDKLEPYYAAQKAKAAEQMRKYQEASQSLKAKFDEITWDMVTKGLPPGAIIQTDSDIGKFVTGSPPKKHRWWMPYK